MGVQKEVSEAIPLKLSPCAPHLPLDFKPQQNPRPLPPAHCSAALYGPLAFILSLVRLLHEAAPTCQGSGATPPIPVLRVVPAPAVCPTQAGHEAGWGHRPSRGQCGLLHYLFLQACWGWPGGREGSRSLGESGEGGCWRGKGGVLGCSLVGHWMGPAPLPGTRK